MSSPWRKDFDSLDQSDRVLTRCRLRSVNYWNYTSGHASLVLGHQFDSAVGALYSPPISHDLLGLYVNRHPFKLSSALNPFFPSLRAGYATSRRKTPTKVTESLCTLVFIFAQWCPFSMRAAPYINALARAFPQLPIVAIESNEYLQYRWSLRVFYIPKIKIFIGGHVYREFNGTDYDLDELADFLWLSLRLLPIGPLELRREDFVGPIPTQLMIRENDLRLPAAWVIFLVCFAYLTTYFVNYKRIWCHAVTAVKSVHHSLNNRRLNRLHRRHVAAHAALPLPASSTHCHAD
ncbi:unnamed protein product [Mesocestoides corti]|nr:unnamed protein product [Mesocestoides corti]